MTLIFSAFLSVCHLWPRSSPGCIPVSLQMLCWISPHEVLSFSVSHIPFFLFVLHTTLPLERLASFLSGVSHCFTKKWWDKGHLTNSHLVYTLYEFLKTPNLWSTVRNFKDQDQHKYNCYFPPKPGEITCLAIFTLFCPGKDESVLMSFFGQM